MEQVTAEQGVRIAALINRRDCSELMAGDALQEMNMLAGKGLSALFNEAMERHARWKANYAEATAELHAMGIPAV